MKDQDAPPVLLWLRRDLRITDNPALTAAAARNQPLIIVFIRDAVVDAMGAAAKWRLGLSLEHLSARLSALGITLSLRSGDALVVLQDLVRETGATALHYNRDYTPDAITRDTAIKSALKTQGVEVTSHNGLLLFEPWTVETGTGGFYRVYTPFWKAVRDREVPAPLNPPTEIRAPASEPGSEQLENWRLGAAMNRGADVVLTHAAVGEEAAMERLDQFCDTSIATYKADRDRLDLDATSRLSENLTYGEISPHQMWTRGRAAMTEGAAGAEHFLKEIVWREFAYHLLFHSPHMLTKNWRDGWDRFPWRGDNEDAENWRRGMTGEPVVDAAMREMYVTGTMHNRARMIVASYLTKHLMVHWKVGMDWFADCLTDWDPASNAMGWQWVAGCGPDAAPFFRIFNPETQAEKFDPDGNYRKRFLDVAEPQARSYFQAVPRRWGLDPDEVYPERRLDLKAGRERALAAWKQYTEAGREIEAQEKGRT